MASEEAYKKTQVRKMTRYWRSDDKKQRLYPQTQEVFSRTKGGSRGARAGH